MALENVFMYARHYFEYVIPYITRSNSILRKYATVVYTMLARPMNPISMEVQKDTNVYGHPLTILYNLTNLRTKPHSTLINMYSGINDVLREIGLDIVDLFNKVNLPEHGVMLCNEVASDLEKYISTINYIARALNKNINCSGNIEYSVPQRIEASVLKTTFEVHISIDDTMYIGVVEIGSNSLMLKILDYHQRDREVIVETLGKLGRALYRYANTCGFPPRHVRDVCVVTLKAPIVAYYVSEELVRHGKVKAGKQ